MTHTGHGRRQRRPRRVGRTILIVIGSIVALGAIAAGVLYIVVANTYNQITRVETIDTTLTRPPVVVPTAGEPPINILLLGVDSREPLNAGNAAELVTTYSTDVMLVVQISPDRQHVTGMSIMRDNWVPIEGFPDDKINAAISLGGLPLAVDTVEDFIGTRIDHVALIDFQSFEGLTDAVGGVTVDNEIAFVARHGGYSFPVGEITLSGKEALGYVRDRFAIEGGDFERVIHQQVFLKGLLKKLISAETLSSPATILEAFNALEPYLIVDEGLDFNTLAALGFELRDLRADDIRFVTSPTHGFGHSEDMQTIAVTDWERVEVIREAFRNGTVHLLDDAVFQERYPQP